MAENCELCNTIDWKDGETYRIVTCHTCSVPMLVLREHRQFTDFEEVLIDLVHRSLWGPAKDSKTIRWEQRKIKDHGHVHFE